MRIGERYDPADLTPMDHFLTARWSLFSTPRSGLHLARAFHDPWPLHRAEAIEVDDHLIAAAGLPQPEGPPLAHWSPTVQVRIGLPQSIG